MRRGWGWGRWGVGGAVPGIVTQSAEGRGTQCRCRNNCHGKQGWPRTNISGGPAFPPQPTSKSRKPLPLPFPGPLALSIFFSSLPLGNYSCLLNLIEASPHQSRGWKQQHFLGFRDSSPQKSSPEHQSETPSSPSALQQSGTLWSTSRS